MDSDWVDLTKIRQWKSDCLASHGSRCDNPMKIWKTTPTWLVDVELECVVPGKDQVNFVALSYTYGGHVGLKMDAELSTRLREPHAFRSPNITSRIPPTLVHAMFVTKQLNERYLWTDALCIGHDNPAETVRQLTMMGSIYASATLTIVATDGDARDGILGLNGISKSRELKQQVLPFGSRNIIVRSTGLFSLVHGNTPYFLRGWTYQERKLATRKLFFLNKSAHWECEHQQSHEDSILGAEIETYIEPRLMESLDGFPELGSLGNIIGDYNEKDLRYPEDALPGIAGMLAVLSRSFEGGFIFGIPEMFFHRALAWTPFWRHTELELRKLSDRPRQDQLPGGQLPSWSWVGWKGLVNLGEEASRINDRCRTIEETYPMVEWYTASSPTLSGSKRRRIHSNWYEHREEWKTGAIKLPGWTAVEMESEEGTFRGEPRIFPARCGGLVYRHQSKMHNKDDWYFPFPVPEISSATEASVPEQTPYLFSRTQRSFVLGQRIGCARDDIDDGRIKIIALCDCSSGNSVGTLHLHSREQLKLFPFAKIKPSSGHDALHDLIDVNTIMKEKRNMDFVVDTTDKSLPKIEIVAVSMTRVNSKTWNQEALRAEKPFRVNEVVNVLWIEWENNIAYRRAAGYVGKQDWQQLEREDVDLVLG
ncbi:hypothetical protein AA0111_g8166 [Alternaria arborescens]|uniref:hypothetical protein n=1 Tax=Alternaria arborescens TaxID=156630 RepID=UPI001074E476|nr:hypothetical protein AA0111_g8166 [Alternaria arborescens]RYO26195.1 hypothetical protein AA0111_g8166 [Alternaria arborescens]